ncbi:MAG: hypothetical protein LBO66_05365 [Deltaproteobacteria bacterium]|nr:hypothetical protein [Deltaproteobacteria bacterium]
MLYAINFFDLAVPLPKVSIIIAPTDNPAQPRSGAAISKQLPINHKEIADKISALYAETLDSFSTRNNLERSGFVAIACEIATPLKEFVFSKIPQHLLK